MEVVKTTTWGWMRSLSLGGLLVVASACATGGAGSGGGVGLTWDLGAATPGDASEKTSRILQQYQYEFERTEGPPNIYLLTRWKQRLPFDDERDAGIDLAQTRFIVEARARTRSPDGPDVYNVRLRVENLFQMRGGSGDWESTGVVTPEFRSYANGVAEEMRAALVSGIRVFSP